MASSLSSRSSSSRCSAAVSAPVAQHAQPQLPQFWRLWTLLPPQRPAALHRPGAARRTARRAAARPQPLRLRLPRHWASTSCSTSAIAAAASFSGYFSSAAIVSKPHCDGEAGLRWLLGEADPSCALMDSTEWSAAGSQLHPHFCLSLFSSGALTPLVVLIRLRLCYPCTAKRHWRRRRFVHRLRSGRPAGRAGRLSAAPLGFSAEWEGSAAALLSFSAPSRPVAPGVLSRQSHLLSLCELIQALAHHHYVSEATALWSVWLGRLGRCLAVRFASLRFAWLTGPMRTPLPIQLHSTPLHCTTQPCLSTRCECLISAQTES